MGESESKQISQAALVSASSKQRQSGLAEVSKTGPFRIYVADPWSQIGCSSLYYRVKGSRFGTRGLLRKYETARFSTPQLDQIGESGRFSQTMQSYVEYVN